MLQRIVKPLPLIRLSNKSHNYHYSSQQSQPQKPTNKRLKSIQFKKNMIKYSIALKAATRKIQDSGIRLNNRFKPFDFITKLLEREDMYQKQSNQRQKVENGKKNSKDRQLEMLKFFSYTSKIMSRLILLMVIFLCFQLMPVIIEDAKLSLGKTITENEMINLLSAGLMNPQIKIVRQFQQKAQYPDQKHSYKTLCIAKEKTTVKTIKKCKVTNLANFLTKLQEINLPYQVSFAYKADQPKSSFQFPLDMIITAVLFYFYFMYLTNGSSLSRQLEKVLSSKKFKPIKPQQIKTYFKDVAGMHEAKQQITQFVDFLKNPDKYIEMGAKIPKGALLTGPPGTGKTLLARACAGEAGVPFFYVSGSEFVQKYVGLGASRVRSLFQSAQKVAPSIIFIDQIDAIGKKRDSGPFSNDQQESTLNQMLVNMDGFDTKNKVIVMAATNLKQSLDPALLRPGRFDRSIEINLPNFQERTEILKVHLAKVTFSKKFTIEQLAKKISILTPGFSGAQLANICNEAAILAARDSKIAIQLLEFEKATQRVMAGLQKRNLFTDQEKQCLAYYECGKAVVSWFTEGADPVIKISIAPYSKSNTGYSHQIKDQMPLMTKTELLNKAMCCLAGRVAEQHFKGFITNNGDKEMKKAKRILTFMVSKFGMSNVIGRIGYPDIQLYAKIDEQVKKLFDQCLLKAKQLVSQKAELIQTLKKLILQRETLSHNILKQILGERPFEDNENYSKFLKETNEHPKTEEQLTLNPPAPK